MRPSIWAETIRVFGSALLLPAALAFALTRRDFMVAVIQELYLVRQLQSSSNPYARRVAGCARGRRPNETYASIADSGQKRLLGVLIWLPRSGPSRFAVLFWLGSHIIQMNIVYR